MEQKTNEHLDKMNREQSIYNGNEPANPISDSSFYRLGLTKREHLAGLAMQTLIQHGFWGSQENIDTNVSQAVKIADALLIELRKNKTE